mmetsp:Transcript_26444/g.54536  ORF Transcript_26444/g.54536 Transcript_26444/m.54536 type:complete len:244 (-) Transcript_26444:95-826(-)
MINSDGFMKCLIPSRCLSSFLIFSMGDSKCSSRSPRILSTDLSTSHINTWSLSFFGIGSLLIKGRDSMWFTMSISIFFFIFSRPPGCTAVRTSSGAIFMKASSSPWTILCNKSAGRKGNFLMTPSSHSSRRFLTDSAMAVSTLSRRICCLSNLYLNKPPMPFFTAPNTALPLIIPKSAESVAAPGWTREYPLLVAVVGISAPTGDTGTKASAPEPRSARRHKIILVDDTIIIVLLLHRFYLTL